MPANPKINIQALKKSGVLDENKFFQRLAEENNFIDAKTAKEFYMGLVRVVTQDLRKNGVARLPHMGHMALVKQKDRMGLAGRYRRMIIGKYVLKFYAKEAWRQYFTKIAEGKSGAEASLDPREKVLGRVLE